MLPLPGTSQTFGQAADFLQHHQRRPRQLRVEDELAVPPGVSLAHVRNQGQTVLRDELMNDVVGSVHELGSQLDGMACQGSPREDASADAIASLQANGGESGSDQLAQCKHAGRPGADHQTTSARSGNRRGGGISAFHPTGLSLAADRTIGQRRLQFCNPGPGYLRVGDVEVLQVGKASQMEDARIGQIGSGEIQAP